MTNNQSARIVLKQRHKRPRFKNTPVSNREHIRYIATRAGVMKDPEMRHGLFGKLSGMEHSASIPDLTAMMKQIYANSKQKTIMYRTILSFREEDAKALNLIHNRKAWEKLINEHALKFAEANRISISRFEWVAAVHMEKGHPHVHICYWDKNQPIMKNDFVLPSVLNKARKEIMKEVFKDELQELLDTKTAVRDAVRVAGADFFSEFEEDMNANEFKHFKRKLMAMGKEYNLPPISFSKIAPKRLLLLANELYKLQLSLPKKGSLKYGFLPPDSKQAIDEVTLKLLTTSKDLSSVFEAYINSNVSLAKFYTSNLKLLDVTKDKAYKEAMKMLGNCVLKAMKQFHQKDWEVRSNEYKQEWVKGFVLSLFSLLSASTQQNEAKIKYDHQSNDLSKQAKKELAKELESQGLDW